MRPRLHACYFGSDPAWHRLARVCEATALEHCGATWDVHVRHVTPEPRTSAMNVPSHASNTMKMDEWYRIVMAAPDGARLLLLDADTIILRSLDDVWERDFDLAYTTKPQPPSRFPFNSGVVFLRVSDRARAFVTGWRDENIRMLGDRSTQCTVPGCVRSHSYHQHWREQYGGINQAALGAMLARGALLGLSILSVPCVEWNCEDFSWRSFGPQTRILHVKSALRQAATRRPHALPPPVVGRLAKLWRETEARLAPMTRTA